MPAHDLIDVLQDPYPPLTQPKIRAAEREIGVQFPEDYIQFLLKCNGGYCHHPVEYVSDVALPGWHGGHVKLRKFFAITDDPDEYNDIRSQSPFDKLTDDPVPPHLVPFADAISQDRFCVVGAGPEFGKVYFWSNDDGRVYFIAPSFTAFLDRVTLPEDRTWNLTDDEAAGIPIFRAIRYGNIGAVKDHLDRGGDVNRKTASGTTLLMYAAHARWPKIFELLLSHNADWRPRDRNGRDALWLAVAAQSLSEARVLLAAGADPNTRDNKGEAPLDMLIEDRMRALLIEYGAKPTPENRDEAEPE
jgi:hypothetical protein